MRYLKKVFLTIESAFNASAKSFQRVALKTNKKLEDSKIKQSEVFEAGRGTATYSTLVLASIDDFVILPSTVPRAQANDYKTS